MDSVRAISDLPGFGAPRLPCRAHMADYHEDRGSSLDRLREGSAAVVSGERQTEPYQADRAFHAMLARFNRGHIADRAVAGLHRLGRAFGWGSGAAAGVEPGRFVRREAILRSWTPFFRSPIRSLVPDQAAAAGSTVCRTRVGTPSIQSARAGVPAE
jgi:hypothetical protein